MKEKLDSIDVLIVGCGAAGMMAGITASEKGAKVLIIEKNDIPGKKLVLTGNGRCNLTNAEPNIRKLVNCYGNNGKFLFNAFSFMGPKEVISFFEKKGVKTKTEKNNRVFPITDNSRDILNVLMSGLKTNNVNISYNSEVNKVNVFNNKITEVGFLRNGKEIKVKSNNYIFSTGGKSYPNTGSDGSSYPLLKKIGHSIIRPIPSLFPFKIKEGWIKELKGVSLDRAKVSFNSKINDIGEIIFTHFGLSGPAILNMSKKINRFLLDKETELNIDFMPDHMMEDIEKDFFKELSLRPNKNIKNYLQEFIPRRLAVSLLLLSDIDISKKLSSITKKERLFLIQRLKKNKVNITGGMNFNNSMVTSGGVSLEEVDQKTMKSKLIDNLYFAGEILDIDGPTGGYNLQACWSTGFLAGKNST
jgi:predicted Rossmann fold flavoprotein